LTKRDILFLQVPVSGWLEAINAHPRLGDKAAMEAKCSAAVSTIQVKTASEQDALFTGQQDVLDEVLKWNSDFEAKFGHVFLQFAHGKSMSDILEHVKAR
jgi:2-oxo-4-hydroxy-4-carboxy--5-ureidoimidazoline (OHCU) decarboxylase